VCRAARRESRRLERVPPVLRRSARDPVLERLETEDDVTWIETIPLSPENEELRRAVEAQMGLYPKEYSQPVHPTADEMSGIVASHSLIPSALEHAFATFGVLMNPELPLERRHHEMIATVVSVTNRCRY
jgi:hypothetical protein